MQVLDIKEDFTLRWSLSAYADPCLHDLSACLLTHTHTHSPPPPPQALRSQAQDGWLQRFLAGGRSQAEINEVAVKGRVDDTVESRRLAWARMSLLVLYFNPSGTGVVGRLCECVIR